ncbi:DUF397 domain-containing protein [Streptomyces sp. NPDC102451]
MRDSKFPEGPVINFGDVSWQPFVQAVRRGDFPPHAT